MAFDDDATVRLPPALAARLAQPAPAPAPATAPAPAAHPAPAGHKHGRRALICALCVGAAGAGAGAWWWTRRAAAPTGPLVADAPPPAVTPAPLPVIAAPPLLDRAGLLANRAVVPTALRWSANPLVWVLDFPSLDLQGQAMNRAAGLIEKASTDRKSVV